MFVGYPYRKKGLKVDDIDTGEYFVSLDVVFYENIFPYTQSSDIVVPPIPAPFHLAVYDHD